MLRLEIFGVIVQCMLLISVFDVYKEDIHTSEQNYQGDQLADRVIIFVLTGLRPDLVYSTVKELKHNIPLWDSIKMHGTIKSEIPTTSKNGFIAFTAGVNEGLLSIVPIERNLDTIFDRVNNNTLYFGPKSDKYCNKKKLWQTINYNIDLNNYKFNDNDETFINVQLSLNIIHKAKIILIHLTEIINSSKSYDCLYLKCIDTVVNIFDQIENLYKLIENRDKNKNVYLLIADHGMTIDGTYGGNTRDEIETFFGIWGKGVNDNKGKNIILKQIQLSNLISTLLGVEIPRNSLAITPVNLLNITEEIKHKYVAFNSLHLTSIAIKSIKQIELIIKLLSYINIEPFKNYNKMLEYKEIVTNLIKTNQFKVKKEISKELIEISLIIIDNMRIIMNTMVHYLIQFASVGWILLLITTIISNYNKNNMNKEKQEEKRDETINKVEEETVNDNRITEEQIFTKKKKFCNLGLNIFAILLIIFTIIVIITHNWSIHYYFYWLVPIIIWRNFFSQLNNWRYLKKCIKAKSLAQLTLNVSMLLLVYELIVWGIQYKFILLISLLSVTIYLTIRCMIVTSSPMLLLSIMTSGMVLSTTLFLDISTKQINPILMNMSGLIWIIAGTIIAFNMRFTFLDYLVTVASLLHHLCSLILINISLMEPKANEYNIIWSQLGMAIVIPFFGGILCKNRLKQIAICLASIFLLFTIVHESFVFFMLFTQAICWFLLEEEYEKVVEKTNLDIPLIFAIFIASSYQIMGHTDDLNFIDTRFTKRFLIEENQLLEYILLIAKHCIVLFLLQTIFVAIIKKRGEDLLFLISILLLNLIGYRYILQLLYWPDYNLISKQLTRHCLIQITIAFLWASFTLAKIITGVSVITKCYNGIVKCKNPLSKKKA